MKSLEIERKMKQTAKKWQSLIKYGELSDERMTLIQRYRERYERLSKEYHFQKECEYIANTKW